MPLTPACENYDETLAPVEFRITSNELWRAARSELSRTKPVTLSPSR